MRCPGLTVLRLMLIVAFIAAGLEAARLARLSLRHAWKADEHRLEALRSRAELAKVEAAKTVLFLGTDNRDFLIGYFNKCINYHNKLLITYYSATLMPWSSVPPDPPVPEPLPALEPLPQMPGSEAGPLPLPPLAVGDDLELSR